MQHSKELKSVLERVTTLFSDFGVDSKKWVLVGPQALRLFGYNIVYNRIDSHFHIMMARETVPWKLGETEKQAVELVPSDDSEFGKAYHRFVRESGWDFDIIIPPADFSSIKKVSQTTFVGEHSMHVITPEGTVDMSEYVLDLIAPEKSKGVSVFCKSVADEAVRLGDSHLSEVSMQLYKKYKQRAIQYGEKFIKGVEFFNATKTIKGSVAYVGSVTGEVCVLRDFGEEDKIKKDCILVAPNVYPKLMPYLKQVKGLVTDQGGALTHASIVARELKIPCIVGTSVATHVLKAGDQVEFDTERGLVILN